MPSGWGSKLALTASTALIFGALVSAPVAFEATDRLVIVKTAAAKGGAEHDGDHGNHGSAGGNGNSASGQANAGNGKALGMNMAVTATAAEEKRATLGKSKTKNTSSAARASPTALANAAPNSRVGKRSEERRVGKECRL